MEQSDLGLHSMLMLHPNINVTGVTSHLLTRQQPFPVHVALLFYVHGKTISRVMPGWSVNRTTLFLGRLGGGRVVRWCWVNFQCRGVLLIWIIEGQGPIALAVGADGGWFGLFFSRLLFLSSFSLSLGDGPI